MSQYPIPTPKAALIAAAVVGAFLLLTLVFAQDLVADRQNYPNPVGRALSLGLGAIGLGMLLGRRSPKAAKWLFRFASLLGLTYVAGQSWSLFQDFDSSARMNLLYWPSWLFVLSVAAGSLILLIKGDRVLPLLLQPRGEN